MEATEASESDGSSPVLLHISVVAERLGLSQYQTRLIVDRGDLASEQIGRRTYIPADAFHRYVDRIRQSA